MGEWGFIGGFFDALQTESPMLGRFWIVLMLVFRIVIVGTVASDMFEDEQEEFICNTLQPGCKQVCYDLAFPISQYRFWVFHIVLIATPSLLYLMYATHQHKKSANPPPSRKRRSRENREKTEETSLRRLYIITVIFRIVAEIGFLFTQWFLYGFEVEAYFECSRSPCPLTVKCYTSRPKEKTIFLFFYFIVGVISAFSSLVELLYAFKKWFCSVQEDKNCCCDCENLHYLEQEETEEQSGGKTMSESTASSVKVKKGSVRSGSGRNVYCMKCKSPRGKYARRKMLMV